MEEKYEVSVVMAVYNTELFICEAIESIIAQDIGFNNIQLILVDDGSTDSSGLICDNYSKKYPQNVLTIHKLNGGVASARNEGLRFANGKYLNFMDSDDRLSKDAFRKMVEFFNAHINETDIVTIPIKFFDAMTGDHWQNEKFKAGSRIIDLCSEPSTTLMFVNASLFHSRVKEKISFDGSLPCGEDIKAIYTIVSDKQAIGVIADTVYWYRRRSAGAPSLIGSAQKKKSWFFEYFENLYFWLADYYQAIYSEIPEYVQSIFSSELQWRFMNTISSNSNKIVERGILTKDELNAYLSILRKALSIVSDKSLLNAKYLYLEQKVFVEYFKYNKAPLLVPESSNETVWLMSSDNTVIADCCLLLNELCFAEISQNELQIEGLQSIPAYLKSDVFLEIKHNDVFSPCKWDGVPMTEEILDTPFLYKRPFKAAVSLSNGKTHSFSFYLNLCGFRIALRNYKFRDYFPISDAIASNFAVLSNWVFHFRDGCFICAPIKKRVLTCMRCKYNWELIKSKYPGARKAVFVRFLYWLLCKFKKKPIWLVSDRIMAAGDNGEAFFKYLVSHHPELKVYFVISRKAHDYTRMKKIGSVVNDQSFSHKMLFLLCDYNISSQANEITNNPFWGHSDPYRDILAQKKLVFLQHGITKDDLSGWLERHKKNLYGFVTAAIPEYHSICKGKYNYSPDNIWLTGFPRFDALYHSEEKIVAVMPTWRSYLLGGPERSTGIRPLRPGFQKSEYYIFYSSLLNNSKLHSLLKQYGYRLLFFPHPEIRNYISLFNLGNDIIVPGSDISYTEIYAKSNLVVTDYSSAVFDFAYLRKPIVYCQFDKEKFFGGEHTYTAGYFEYERDGFGEVAYDLDSAIDLIAEYIKGGCKLEETYRNRIDKFFAFHDSKNCERLYNEIIKHESN